MHPYQVIYDNCLANLVTQFNGQVGQVCTTLLSTLKSVGVIEQPDYAFITETNDTMERANRLFKSVMPAKDEGLHRLFITIFKQHKYGAFVDYLESEIEKIEAIQGNSFSQSDPSAHTRLAEVSLEKNSLENLLALAYFGQSLGNLPPPAISFVQPPVQAANTILGPNEKELKSEQILLNETPGHGYLFLPVQKMSSLPADNYYMNFSKPKGLALLINNQTYNNSIYQERTGSKVDFANMHILLNKLDYHVHCKMDRKGDEMLEDVKQFASCFSRQDSCKYDSCIVVVMCYSENGYFVGVDGKMVPPKEFFNCITMSPALKEKPKLFFIQACRQAIINNITEMDIPKVKTMERNAIDALRAQLPDDGEDFFIFYSTTPGCYSWMNEERGSWFIETICQEFPARAHERLPELCVQVTDSVRKKLNSDHKRCIQLPDMEFRMSDKHFYFFPGLDGPTATD